MHSTLSKLCRCLWIATLLASGASAARAAPDVRELSTDRPDATESPLTVPRGWVQAEMDAVAWSRDEGERVKATRTSGAALNLKFGVAPDLDLQLVFEPWVQTRSEVLGPGTPGTGGPGATRTSASGDAQVRAKWNLIGNDGGRFAVGLLPRVSWDTARRGDGPADAAGLAVPVAFAATDRIGLGAMAEASVSKAEHAFLATATIGLDLGAGAGCLGELAVERVVTAGQDASLATLNAGLTRVLTPDLQLDGGLRAGLSEAADDLAFFAGLAYRRSLR